MVSADDGISTCEYKDKYVIYPQIVLTKPLKKGTKVFGPEFEGYRSDINDRWLKVNELRKMIKDHEDQ
jgi:hypothetical protein